MLIRSKAPAVPRDAAETLNYVLRCSRERDAKFQANQYDIEILEVERDSDRGYEVWFKPKGGGRSSASTFGCQVMGSGGLAGYCMALEVASRP